MSVTDLPFATVDADEVIAFFHGQEWSLLESDDSDSFSLLGGGDSYGYGLDYDSDSDSWHTYRPEIPWFENADPYLP